MSTPPTPTPASPLKVRFGYAAGAGTNPGELDRFAELVDALERHGFDSIWVPEIVTAATLDPITALAFAAGRTRKLKMGSHLVAVGRNPARLAKELATLDRLSGGRLLLTFVIGLAEPAELSAYGVAGDERTAMLDELLPLLRALWTGEPVTHHGRFFDLDGVTIPNRPVQDPLEVWFGGMAPAALRRCGRLADGWIPGTILPDRAAAAKRAIDEAADAAGRVVDPEHFGMNVLYSVGPIPEAVRARLTARNPGVDVDDLVPSSDGALVDLLGRYVEAGFSKFVLRPTSPPPDWDGELGRLAAVVLPLGR